MKKIVLVSIILCVFIVKAEESLFFPILDWGHGRPESWYVSGSVERTRVANLGLTAVMGGGNALYQKYGDDSLMYYVCDPTGIRMFLGNDPTIRNTVTGLNYSDADKILGFYLKNPNYFCPDSFSLQSYHYRHAGVCTTRYYEVTHDSNRILSTHTNPAYCPDPESTPVTVWTRLHRIADSMTCHKGGILGDTSLKDHNMGYYLVCHEGPEAYCAECYEAIEELCERIKLRDPAHKTWAWVGDLLYGSARRQVRDSLWSICKNLDVISLPSYCAFRDDKTPDSIRYIQEMLDTVVTRLDTATAVMRYNENRLPGKKFEWHTVMTDWRKRRYGYDPPIKHHRRPTEQEMRCWTSLGLSRGAQGVVWMTYCSGSHPETAPEGTEDIYGLVDHPNRVPYDTNNPDSMYWDPPASGQKWCPSYTWVSNINRDLKNLGPAFRAIDWDTATSVKTAWNDSIWDDNRLRYVEKVEWVKKPENDWDSLCAELGLFEGNVENPDTTPTAPDSLYREYITVVNRHTISPGDTAKINLYLDKVGQDSFPFTPKWVIDMRRYKYSSLDSNNGNWIINHDGWTYYLHKRDWKPLPALQPGEGRLYAVVDDDYLWDVAGDVEKYSSDSKSKPAIICSVMTWSRGELFKNGPRRKDVGYVKVYQVFPPKSDSTRDSILLVERCPIEQDTWDYWQPEVEGWDEELADSCYKSKEKFSVIIEDSLNTGDTLSILAYNTLGEFIGCPTFSLNFIPNDSSIFQWMTAQPCQDGKDPEGVYHTVYTGGMEDTLAYYMQFMPGNTTPIVFDTLDSGKYPDMILKRGISQDTVGCAYLSKNGDAIYYRVRKDSLWTSPYQIVATTNKNSLSVPRMVLDIKDTVHITYAKKEDPHIKLYYGKFHFLHPEGLTVESVSSWLPRNFLNPIDRLGAGVVVDYKNRPHLAWIERETTTKYGFKTGENWVTKILSVSEEGVDTCYISSRTPKCLANVKIWVIVPYIPPGPPPGLPYPSLLKGVKTRTNLRFHILEPTPSTVPSHVAWLHRGEGGVKTAIHSMFYSGDTTEILRDTICIGERIVNLGVYGNTATFERDGNIFVSLYNSIERKWSEPETLESTNLYASYPRLIAPMQYVDLQDNISVVRFVLWGQERADSLYELGGDIRRYEDKGEYGVTPYHYLRLGTEKPTPFTVWRDSFEVYGDEDYMKVDIGEDSLVYDISSFIDSTGKNRIFLEFYRPSDTAQGDWMVGVELNDTVIKDSIIISQGQPTRVFEFISSEVLASGELNIRLLKRSGDFIPCSRIMLSRFELEEGTSSMLQRGRESKKVIPEIFRLYQSYPNPTTKTPIIKFQIPVKTAVSLKVYDVGGRVVRTLTKAPSLKPGIYTVEWKERNDKGLKVPAGVYFYRLKTKEYKATKKLVWVR